MNSVEFFVLGVNHRTASIEVREQFALTFEQQGLWLGELVSHGLLDEAAVLCTCNRMELYGVVYGRALPKDQIETALTALTDRTNHGLASFYCHSGERALRHLFRVASSLDSQVIGETHILGQVKDCYERSRQAAASGKYLNIFFQKSFQVAKKVRNETEITALPVSMGSCSVAVSKRIFGDLLGRRVLLVGTGEVGRNVARHFAKNGVLLTIVNRTRSKAEALAENLQGRVTDFEKLHSEMAATDIAIFATRSLEPLLTRDQAAAAAWQRKHRQFLVLDLSVPRNVAPTVGNIPSVFLYDIDRVQKVVEAHFTIRAREAKKAEAIIEASALRQWEKVVFQPAHSVQ